MQKEFGHLPQAELEQIKAKLVAGETVDVKFEREGAEEKPAQMRIWIGSMIRNELVGNGGHRPQGFFGRYEGVDPSRDSS